MKLKRRRPPFKPSAEEIRCEEPPTAVTIGGLSHGQFYAFANRLARIAVVPSSPLAPLFTSEEVERKLALYAELELILNELRRDTSERPSLTRTLSTAAIRRRAIDAGDVLEFKRR